MKYIMALLLSFALFSCSCAGSLRGQYYADVDYVGHMSSVRIIATCSNGDRGLGTGVAISPDTVLTALHVTTCDDGPAMIVEVVDYKGDKFLVVNEFSKDDEVDITKLVVEKRPFQVWATINRHMP